MVLVSCVLSIDGAGAGRKSDRRLDKTILRAPADGLVSVIVAEIGENIHAGQPDRGSRQGVVVVQRARRFFARPQVGEKVTIMAAAGAGKPMPALVTEPMPLGTFATWQAERAVGDHNRNTLRLRIEPLGDQAGLLPGMTV